MLLHKDKEAFEDILAQTDDEHQVSCVTRKNRFICR